jgi:hypothetical protein
MKNLKNKVLDDMDDNLLEGSLKMVQLEANYEDFFRLFNKQNVYDSEIDDDIILSDGDLYKAINLKRERAQRNLIRFGLIKKIA